MSRELRLCPVLFARASPLLSRGMGFDVDGLVERLRVGGDGEKDAVVALRRAAMNGRSVQDRVRELCFPLIRVRILESGPLLLEYLNLCNNLCVDNPVSQEIVFPVLQDASAAIRWDHRTAGAALHVFLACCQLDSPRRVSVALIEPFMSLEVGDDDFEFLLINVMARVAAGLLCRDDGRTLDRLRDAAEECARVIDPSAFLTAARVEMSRRDRDRTRIAGIVSSFLGASHAGRVVARDLGFPEFIQGLTRDWGKEPMLRDWCVAILRILEAEEDADGEV